MLEKCSVIAFIFWWLNPGRQKSGRHHFRSLSCHKQGAVTRVNYLIILRGLPAMSPFWHFAILPFQHFGWLMGQHLQHLLCCLLLPPPFHFRFRRLAKICPPSHRWAVKRPRLPTCLANGKVFCLYPIHGRTKGRQQGLVASAALVARK